MNSFLTILKRDVRLAIRDGNTGGMAVAFFLIVVTLFPLGVGPELPILARISAGVIWAAALLSALLSLDGLFQADFEDGALDLFALSDPPLEYVVAAKAVAHWVVTGLPIIVAAPFLAILMNIPADGLWILVLSMAIGTPGLSFIGAIGAALTVTLKQGGALVPILVLPLYIPILIFGVSAIDSAIFGGNPVPSLLILGAITLFAMGLAPFAAAAALRAALE